jgi:branched-chain amino acid transport system substrate-binding protein
MMNTDFIRIGALATLVGPYAGMGEDGIRGVELAIAEFGGQIAGKRVLLIRESSNAMPEDAQIGTQTLLDQHGADFVIGPLSANEGMAVRDYAKTRLDKAFINGNAAAQDMTLRDPAPNMFSFSTNGVQWMAGLGTYAYEVQGYRRVATLGEDYTYPYSQVGGFMIEFCRAGGKVVRKFWVPLGTVSYDSVIAALPDDVDAIYVCLAGADALNFLKQYELSGKVKPLIGGTTITDQTVLSVKGTLIDRIVGMASAGPIADNNPDPAWQSFVKAYRDKYPKGLQSPSLFAFGYYVNTKGALLALQSIGGDLSDKQTRFKAALAALEFNSPTGPLKLDHNRQAVANMFLTTIAKKDDGTLYNQLIKTIPAVNTTLGVPETDYLKIGPLGRDNPACA